MMAQQIMYSKSKEINPESKIQEILDPNVSVGIWAHEHST